MPVLVRNESPNPWIFGASGGARQIAAGETQLVSDDEWGSVITAKRGPGFLNPLWPAQTQSDVQMIELEHSLPNGSITPEVTYIGSAPQGSALDGPVWSIKKFDYTTVAGANLITQIQVLQRAIWDDRTTIWNSGATFIWEYDGAQAVQCTYTDYPASDTPAYLVVTQGSTLLPSTSRAISEGDSGVIGVSTVNILLPIQPPGYPGSVKLVYDGDHHCTFTWTDLELDPLIPGIAITVPTTSSDVYTSLSTSGTLVIDMTVNNTWDELSIPIGGEFRPTIDYGADDHGEFGGGGQYTDEQRFFRGTPGTISAPAGIPFLARLIGSDGTIRSQRVFFYGTAALLRR